MSLSLVPLTPAAAPPNRLQGCIFTREFPLRIKRRGVAMRFASDAPGPRATNPGPVLGHLRGNGVRFGTAADTLAALAFPPSLHRPHVAR